MRSFGLIVVFLLTSGIAIGDTVSVSDGSILVGKIENFADGKVVILTQIAGRLEIDASLVTAITTDESVNVELDSGDKLVGPVSAGSGQNVSVNSAVGAIEFPTDRITAVWPQGTEHPAMVALREQTEAEIQAARPKWTATLEAGGTMTEGNTDTLVAHGRFDLIRKTDEDLLKFYIAANYSEQNKSRTTNKYRGGIRYEKDLTERWYAYTGLELEFDEFENLDLRATVTVGAGYYWLQKPDHELKTRGGIGYRHESFTNGRTENDLVVDLGLDYRLDIADWVQFTHSSTYSPDIEDFANYRLDLDSALVFPFKDDRWSWKFGMRNEYNSRPQRGLDRLDNTYYTALVLKLKDG